jgi:hypothetical protein
MLGLDTIQITRLAIVILRYNTATSPYRRQQDRVDAILSLIVRANNKDGTRIGQ